MVTVSVNNQPQTLESAVSIAEALTYWTDLIGDDNRQFAIAVNGEFVPRGQYDAVVLNDGDTVDLVKAVVGG